MKRASYSNSITSFLLDSDKSILGYLSQNHTNRSLEELQINAWVRQISLLKEQLKNVSGMVYFEFLIPRMGKKVDNILIIHDTIFVIEFKVGEREFHKSSIVQAIDYSIDLKNFHQGSHNKKIIPVLVATNAKQVSELQQEIFEFNTTVKCNSDNLFQAIVKYINYNNPPIDIEEWEKSVYKPTPTIVEAAQALYNGHNVEEITRADSGAINLSKTANCINSIIDESKNENVKSICFVTGVPGAGKTLAGLNIAVNRKGKDKNENAVFLSGNGPLVEVLQEALARDKYQNLKNTSKKIQRASATREAKTFIQNIHHFRDDNLKNNTPDSEFTAPIEKVVVFDEAQRAWTKKQTSDFMLRKKGLENFDKSEPEFLIEIMDRHPDWCTIICLIGGGQEINTGEAGLEEWINSLKLKFPNWKVYISDKIITDSDYLKLKDSRTWLKEKAEIKEHLHLSVSVRSFRSEKLSAFVQSLLNIDLTNSKSTLFEIKNSYPIFITRDLNSAKKWLRDMAKGSERIGIISSSGAKRLRANGIDVNYKISAPNWFLNGPEDIRSSYFLEEVATEFDIQGLEIDWACVAWGGNFHIKDDNWTYKKFRGTKWQNIKQQVDKEYLKNTYRVLLTRARQGMVIFVPKIEKNDPTRPKEFYDETYNYLRNIGINELPLNYSL